MRSGLILLSIVLSLVGGAASAQMPPAAPAASEDAASRMAALVERLRARATLNERTIVELRERLRMLKATRIRVPDTNMIFPNAALGPSAAPAGELQQLRTRVAGQQDLIARLRERIARLERLPLR